MLIYSKLGVDMLVMHCVVGFYGCFWGCFGVVSGVEWEGVGKMASG